MTVSTKYITVALAVKLRDTHQLHLVGWDAMKVVYVDYLITHTDTCIYIYKYIYIYYLRSLKFYIKTFKTLLHVSITRSSSDSIYCSLLKL